MSVSGGLVDHAYSCRERWSLLRLVVNTDADGNIVAWCSHNTVKSARISVDILWRVVHFLTEPIPLKYGKLATYSEDILILFTVYGAIITIIRPTVHALSECIIHCFSRTSLYVCAYFSIDCANLCQKCAERLL